MHKYVKIKQICTKNHDTERHTPGRLTSNLFEENKLEIFHTSIASFRSHLTVSNYFLKNPVTQPLSGKNART